MMTRSIKHKKFNITLVLISYKSSNQVLGHLRKFRDLMPIIVIDNYGELELEKNISENYKEVNYFKKNNLGYGKAINFASKNIITKYFFVINPDISISSLEMSKLNSIIKNKNIQFCAIGPNIIENRNQKFLKYSDGLVKVSDINGSAMLFDLESFLKIDGFDNNIFLFYEEADFNIRANDIGMNILVAIDVKCSHGVGKSYEFENKYEHMKINLLLAWHGEWSRFYFYRKHNGFFIAILLSFPRMIKNLIQMVLNFFIKKQKYYNYLYRFKGMIRSISGKGSDLRIENIKI